MMTLALAAVYLLPAGLAADPAGYPNATLLIEVDALKAAGPGKFRVLDVRGKGKFEAGHALGAVLAPLGIWSKAVTDGKADAAFWKKELAAVGVSPGVPVVVVSDDVRDAARGWWLLTYAGVPDVRLLNGGWSADAADKLSRTAATLAPFAVEPHDWTPAPGRLVTKADLLAILKADVMPCVVDARTAGEYTGEDKTAKKAGHVPGAVHLEWSDLLDPATKKFKPAAELAKLFAERKVDVSRPCVTYCQSGGRSSVMAFGLTLMGAKDVRNYYKSWAEWGNAPDTPVEGPKK